MPNSLDVDVDVDWLYRGKKRGKTNAKKLESAGSHSLASVSAGASTAGVNSSEGAGTGSFSTGSSGVQHVSQDRHLHSEEKLLRSRSASVTNRPTAAAAAAASGASSASVLKRSSSLGEKPKKSLFGSLFGRKAAASAASAAATPVASGAGTSPLPGGTASHSEVGATSAGGAAVSAAVPAGGSGGSSKLVPMPINMSSHRQQISQFLKEPSSPEVKDIAPIREDRVVLNRNPNKNRNALLIKELSELTLKRVAFAVDKFGMDPPQQIPSRKPKLGNVLVPDDMLSAAPSISQGITTTQGSAASETGTAVSYSKDSKEYKIALENHRRALKESEKHQQEAHFAAQRIASEVATFKNRAGQPSQPSLGPSHTQSFAAQSSTAEDEKVKSLEIDKPIHMHEHHFQEGASSSKQGTEADELMLDLIYTRCCHLREILPIPSTLRQLKEKTAPLQTLKFLNPRPTLIDILSFCDFLAIVPVHNVVFDNVGLTPEMFKIMISSLVNSTALEKLSMRNVVIDKEGWKLLCKFLMRNSSVVKLDISQTKIRHDLDLKLHRSQMDWPLFIDVLQKRKGKPLEELLLNGISFENNLETFDSLIHAFSSTGKNLSKKRKLGLAQSQISTPQQIELLFRWMSENEIVGVDLAFNDFDDLTKPIIKELSQLDMNHLQYFTLNSTNIQSVQEAALIIRELSKLPTLYLLDLSGLPSLFPDIFPYLNKYLPRFPSLKRLHFDSNEWTYKDVSMITQILPKCKQLLHVSMMNQPKESWTMSTAVFLYDCIKNSDKLINVDINYENIPEEINSRIAIALVRNAQRSIDSNWQLDELSSQDDLLFDGELITETAGNILDKLNDAEKLQNDATKRYLLKRYWEKIDGIHDNVQKTIDDLFEQRSSKELSLQSKENLLRLIFMENTLANILEILSSNPYIKELRELKPMDDDKNSISEDMSSLKHVHSENLRYGQPLSNSMELDQELEQEQNNVRPHLMATDSGRTIDVMTGKPVLSKTTSERSIFGRKQEEEEGELHKWGFYIQQQRSIYPESATMSKFQQEQKQQQKQQQRQLPPLQTTMPFRSPQQSTPEQKTPVEVHGHNASGSQSAGSSSADSATSSTPSTLPAGQQVKTQPASAKLIGKIPSGTELREAIIKAKGINSIEDLIDNVNCQRVKLDNIYGIQVEPPSDAKPLTDGAGTPSKPLADMEINEEAQSRPHDIGFISESEDSFVEEELTGKDLNVDEKYDKLLNNLSRVRSNKG